MEIDREFKNYISSEEFENLYLNKPFYHNVSVDLHGNPVKNTKWNCPYSYDAFVVIRNGKNEEIEHTAYSDRMLSWVSYDKWKKCIAKMGDKKAGTFSNNSVEKLEAFLTEYNGYKCKLIVLMEGCNVSNGYPYWIFFWKKLK